MTEEESISYEIPDDVSEKLGDRYSQFEYLSSGATSAVYKAHDDILGIFVAIKILKRTEEKDLVRFQKEAKALSQVKHKNLVQILDFNVTAQNHAYLIMEYIEGMDLRSLLKVKGSLSVPSSLYITSQICQALSHAHSKNVIHRDLKTSNIIINNFEDPHVTVVDFGLATQRAVDDRTTVKIADQDTTEGKIVGSPLYMSPEQAQGKKTDERTDIYSLGCILFELLTGKTPFTSADAISLLNMHIKEAPPTLEQTNPQENFPLMLENILAKMLAKYPDDRFQNMEEVLDGLNQLREEDDEIVEPEKEAISDTSKKRKIAISIVVFSLIIFGSYGLFNLVANQSPKKTMQNGTSKSKPVPKTMMEALICKNPSIEKIVENFHSNVSQFHEGHSTTLWYCLNEDDGFKLKDGDLRYLPDIIEALKEKDQIEQKAIANKSKNQKSERDKNAPLKTGLAAFSDLTIISDGKFKHKKDRFKRISLSGASISGEGLKYLVDCDIEYLDLSNTNLQREAYSAISRFKQLKSLTLNNSPISNDELNKLWQSKTLKFIRLDNCKNITDKGFANLADCKSLLKISMCLKASKSLKQCVKEGICNENIDDAVIEKLAKNPKITKLFLDGSAVTDSGIDYLVTTEARKENPIVELDVNGCQNVTGKTLESLAKHNPELEYLGIGYTKVNTEDLKLLSHFKKLRRLFLMDIEMDEESMKAIGSLKGLQWLYLGKVISKDESLKYLYNLKKPEVVTFDKTPNISVTALRKLKKELRKKNKKVKLVNLKLKNSGLIDKDQELVFDLFK